MFARYYGSNLARFLSTDPVVKRRKNSRAPQRWNRYVYSLNNPIKFYDPNGEDVELSPGFQSLVSDGSKQFRQVWSAVLASDAGQKYYSKLDDNHETKVVIRAREDSYFDLNTPPDGVGDAHGETQITDMESGAVDEQVISINFEDTGGAEQLAETLLDELIHASENVDSDGTSTEGEDHELKDEEMEETDFKEQVDKHIEKNP